MSVAMLGLTCNWTSLVTRCLTGEVEAGSIETDDLWSDRVRTVGIHSGFILTDVGYGSIATGVGSEAQGSSSASFGYGAVATSAGYQTVLGIANEVVGDGQYYTDEDYPLVVIGNGDDPWTGSTSNIMVVRRNGIEITEDVSIDGEVDITADACQGRHRDGELRRQLINRRTRQSNLSHPAIL